jgi:hypothetical protein
VWLGYYRSEDGGASFASSLVPGYPGDTSLFAQLSHAHPERGRRGDCVGQARPGLLWGRVVRRPRGLEEGLWRRVGGDVRQPGRRCLDGKRFVQSTIVMRGSSSPDQKGKFNDKTAIEVDRTGVRCDGNVYLAASVFTGGSAHAGVQILFSRSTDHGATWSTPRQVSTVGVPGDLQFPDIAVTSNGDVHLVYRRFARNNEPDAIMWVKSTDCGATFSRPPVLTSFVPYDAADFAAPAAPPAQTAPTMSKATRSAAKQHSASAPANQTQMRAIAGTLLPNAAPTTPSFVVRRRRAFPQTRAAARPTKSFLCTTRQFPERKLRAELLIKVFLPVLRRSRRSISPRLTARQAPFCPALFRNVSGLAQWDINGLRTCTQTKAKLSLFPTTVATIPTTTPSVRSETMQKASLVLPSTRMQHVRSTLV